MVCAQTSHSTLDAVLTSSIYPKLPRLTELGYTPCMSEEKTNENEKDATQKKDEWGFNYWETVTQDELKTWKEAAEKAKKFRGKFYLRHR